MDSSDLLARENEFKKLNKQLEKKTESLMKEIENVMQKQDIFSDLSHKLRITPSPRGVKKHCCDSLQTASVKSGNYITNQKHLGNRPNNTNNKPQKILNDNIGTKNEALAEKQQNSNRHSTADNYNCSNNVMCQNCMFDKNGRLSDDIEFLYAFVSVNVKDNVLPQSLLKERVTVESVCKFLAAKVKLLQEQLAKMQNTIEKKGQQCEVHLAQTAELEGEKMSLLNKAKKARAEVTEARAKYTALQGQLEEKERLYKEQRGVGDRLATELKQARGRSAALEARCAAHEEAEAALKQQLALAKASHQEFKDSSRSLSASQESAISRLEGRIRQLGGCVQKQNALIENLKQQNSVLAMQAAAASLECEYTDFLKRDL